MLELVWLIPALPLLGFVVLLLFGKRIGEPLSGWLATAMTAGSFLVAVAIFIDLLGKNAEERSHTEVLWSWIPSGGFKVNAALLVDPLSITMVLFVTGIGTLIHLYAIGYMHGDSRFPRFFTYLNLFVFSMLCLVLGDNFLLMFLGWEGVGTCSYLLISFWFERETAASAGKKAFVTNRVGDFGLMIAMFMIFESTGSLTYRDVFATTIGKSTVTAICLLLFLGACGKSAQLPLYVWLPDAMEGPTPVSALIHAATMVTAGVYLMVRVTPLLDLSAHWVLTVIAWIGALTALFAATIAVAQNDIKRVLAYSTISQLGYMFLAVGMGAPVAAMFHVITHAFFKALMFLGAGSVIHGMHDEQDMKRMGNLRKWMPLTTGTFIMGWLSIAGVPPFAGFWSKDEILLAAWEHNKLLWVVGLVTAALTAYYMSRQVFLVFFGRERFLHSAVADFAPPEAHDEHGHVVGNVTPHESPMTMVLPLFVLAGLAVVGGVLNLPFGHKWHLLDNWLAGSIGSEHESLASASTKVALAIFATVAGLLGMAFAFRTWLSAGANEQTQTALEPDLLRRGYGVDALYSAIIEKPGRELAEGLGTVVDQQLIDGAVNGVGRGVNSLGGVLRKVQSGYVRGYAGVILGGTVALVLYAIVRAGVR